MRIAFYTLGCKVNQYESELMTEQFQKLGYELCSHNDDADVYVINSCTVTAESDRKTRQAVRKFKRLHSDSLVVLTGCLPQAFPEISDELTEADIVMGNKNPLAVIEAVNSYYSCGQRLIKIDEHEKGERFAAGSIQSFAERTRAYVKIEDGCNRFCSYCIIPYARGRVRSRPIESLKEEISALDKAGFKEIVLVGINLSAYGSDIGLTLFDAVSPCCSFNNIERVRLGSLEPDHMDNGLIEKLSGLSKLCPQFHISLQSGCNKTLKAMNRHYDNFEYEALANKLRSVFNNCTLSTDVMVGFPGESEEDFFESLNFVKKIAFEKVHVFPYSKRKGTKAADMDMQISKSEKERRSRLLSEAANEIRREFFKNQIGETLEVLVEEYTNNGAAQGYTVNYIPVKILNSKPQCNKLYKVKIIDSNSDYCIGSPV